MRRYCAPSMAVALKQIRQDQGGDAVILSQRTVVGGVEVVAAVDPDADISTASTSKPVYSPRVYSNHRSEKITEVTKSVIPNGLDNSVEMSSLKRDMEQMRTMMEQHLSLVNKVSPIQGDPKEAWLTERLSSLGISSDIGAQIWEDIGSTNSVSGDDRHWQRGLEWLDSKLSLDDPDEQILQKGGVVALVGPTGVGKTTTAAKLAARYAMRHGSSKVALITTDSYRIGAQEQLRSFGELIGVPVYAVNSADELHTTLHSLQDRELVLIDTAGLSQRDRQLLEQLAILRTGEIKIDPYLVVAANSQESALNEAVTMFNRIELKGAILSKLDEGGSLGPALSVLIRHQLPLHYLGDGQRVPEDLQVARGSDLVDRLVAQQQLSSESSQMVAPLQAVV